ncbi:hypothetical protein PTKIN_Ptkin02bG0138700 [Pterospermum kingtungense]
MLDDSQIAEILNEISRQIVLEKGVLSWTYQGLQRRDLRGNLLCRAFLGRFYIYPSEDVDKLQLHAFSEAGDIEALEKDGRWF